MQNYTKLTDIDCNEKFIILKKLDGSEVHIKGSKMEQVMIEPDGRVIIDFGKKGYFEIDTDGKEQMVNVLSKLCGRPVC